MKRRQLRKEKKDRLFEKKKKLVGKFINEKLAEAQSDNDTIRISDLF